MDKSGFNNITSDELKKYVEKRKEKEYILIDVRQDLEYKKDHIPGAKNIPLMELESKLFDLPSNMDMVFYCHSGGRSLAATNMVVESEVSNKKIYNLLGGIIAWRGKKLQDLPRIQVFNRTGSIDKILLTAIDLEKGAWRFYNYILEEFPAEAFKNIIKNMAKEEKSHAQKLYSCLVKNKQSSQSFDTLFKNFKGEILEGGENFNDIIQKLTQKKGNPCINLLDMSLHIEYSAFDLYRIMSEKTEDIETKNIFLSISQAEKAHIRIISKAFSQCPDKR